MAINEVFAHNHQLFETLRQQGHADEVYPNMLALQACTPVLDGYATIQPNPPNYPTLVHPTEPTQLSHISTSLSNYSHISTSLCASMQDRACAHARPSACLPMACSHACTRAHTHAWMQFVSSIVAALDLRGQHPGMLSALRVAVNSSIESTETHEQLHDLQNLVVLRLLKVTNSLHISHRKHIRHNIIVVMSRSGRNRRSSSRGHSSHVGI